MAGQQQEEIETIRSRTIEVKLSDADVKRISEKAAAHGLTVGELIENFIGVEPLVVVDFGASLNVPLPYNLVG